MTIHIDYDREENKIESILASQSNVIRTLKMPFLGTIWILPKSRLVLNFGAIFAACCGPAKMAQKFKISLDFGRIQIKGKNGIFK